MGKRKMKLICPACHSVLYIGAQKCVCHNISCGKVYPVVSGVPILIDESNSLFTTEGIIMNESYAKARQHSVIYEKLVELIPNPSSNTKTVSTINKLNQALTQRAKILHIGVLNGSYGLDILYKNHDVYEVDIQFNKNLVCVCDLHSLPFEEKTFDAVVIQNVLEHVLDPNICVENIYRVLKNEGIVFSEVPFMQQVHAGQYDFTRYTKRGHVWLFKNFALIDAGWVAGPGTVLSWSIEYFLLAVFNSSKSRKIIITLSRIMFFWLKYFDYYVRDKPEVSVAASSTFVLARKSTNSLNKKQFADITP